MSVHVYGSIDNPVQSCEIKQFFLLGLTAADKLISFLSLSYIFSLKSIYYLLILYHAST